MISRSITRSFRGTFIRLAFTLGAITLAATVGLSADARPVIPVPIPTPTHRQKFDTTRFVPESELKNGQVGYALTVFHGTTIERFGVKILGVLQKVNNGKDLILIKVTDGPSVTRQANIAHGMSGSPVYIGKRMVGAIAYGLPFAREPIGLVTPIGDMLDSWDPDLPAKPSIGMTANTAGGISPVMVPASALARYIAPGELASSPQDVMTIEPMMTPVMISGMTPGGIAKLGPILQPYGLMPMAGGGGSGSTRPPTASEMASLVPGAAVGVSLVQGDVDMTAIGTLTYRDGNKVIAFGHPFTGIGPIDAAMTTATITDLFPSVQDSTKLGAPVATVGRIFQDRPFSVGGVIGSMPQMIPVTVDINDESDNRQKSYFMRVINHPLLTGPLITQVVNESILETHGTPGDAVAYVTMDVDAEQIGHITRHNVFYDALSINQSATSDLDNLLGLLSANPFYPLAVKSVSMKIDIRSNHDTAQIDHIYVPKEKYQPGDTVQIGVVLKPYKQERVVKTIAVTIPMSTPDGSLTLNVHGGSTPTAISMASLGGGSGDAIVIRNPSTTSTAANITQLVRKFLEQPKNNEMVADLELPTTALNVEGEKLSLLPPNFSAVMRGQHSSGLKSERDEVKVTDIEPYVVTGSATLVIKVARKNPLDTTDGATASAQADATASVGSLDIDSAYSVAEISAKANPAIVAATTDSIQARTPTAVHSGTLVLAAVPTPPAVPAQNSTISPATAAPTPPVVGAVATIDDESDSDGSSDAADNGDGGDSDSGKSTPVARTAAIWRQDSAEDFATGDLENIAITSANDLRPAASPEQIAATDSNYVWSIVPDGQGNLYAGTGDDGSIYKVTAKGNTTKYASTGELEVTSLARNPVTGDIYAGTAPHGFIFWVHNGIAKKVFAAPEKYITAMLLDVAHGKLYAATGGGAAKLYVADLGPGLDASPIAFSTIWTSQESHILSLAIDSQSNIYAGTAPNGLVYAITPAGITPAGKVRVVLDAPQPNITALAIGKGDTLYAGTSPKGMIYKVTQNPLGVAPDLMALLPKAGPAIYALQTDQTGKVWGTAGNTLYSIAPDDTLVAHTADADTEFTTVALDPNGEIYAGTTDGGRIFNLAMAEASPATYTSAVHDARRNSHWGILSWTGSTPHGGSVVFQTRSGNVAKPDSTWSAWTQVLGSGSDHPIASPPGRYLQYQLSIPGTAGGSDNGTRISSVSVYYLPRNQKPTVKMMAPSAGDAISGTYKIHWTGTDPDKDTLDYNLFYSKDGASWMPINMDTPPVAPPATITAPASVAPPAPDATPATPQSTPAKPPTAGKPGSKSSSHAANPKSMPSAPPMPSAPNSSASQTTPTPKSGAKSSTAPPTPANDADLPLNMPSHTVDVDAGTSTDTVAASDNSKLSPHRASTFKWDTKKVPDGSYQIKIVADDSPSNAVDAQNADAIIGAIVVDNTPPTVKIDSSDADSNGQITVTGSATGNLAAIKDVQYKLDDSNDWIAAAPADGIFDTAQQKFSLITKPLPTGTHKVTIEAISESGLTGMAVANVTIATAKILALYPRDGSKPMVATPEFTMKF